MHKIIDLNINNGPNIGIYCCRFHYSIEFVTITLLSQGSACSLWIVGSLPEKFIFKNLKFSKLNKLSSH